MIPIQKGLKKKNYFHLRNLLMRSEVLFFKGLIFKRASLIAQLVKNLPAMQETLVQFLGWENTLAKG